MRYTLKSLIVCLVVVAMTLQPAGACHWFRSHGGGGYWDASHWGAHHWRGHHSGGYASWGSGYYYGPAGYGGYCGGGPVAYSGSYGGCSGCGSCDGGAWGCDACDGAAIDGGVVDSSREPMPAPAPPRENGVRERALPPPPQRPATVDRPVDREVAPTLPPPPPEDTFAPRSEPSPTTPLPTQPLPPAEPEDDDLFGQPADRPADAPDDLFNGTEAATPPTTPPSTPAPPTTPPPAETQTPAEPEQPAEEPADDTLDLFGTGTATETPPATDQMPADEAAETPAEETPAEEQPAEEKPAEEDADIFDFGRTRAVLGEPGGLASEDMRVWIDNTGSYSCRGRLVRFMDGQVQLLKDNGRTTTVPLYRLSASDLEFVHRQASAQQAEALQTAQR